MQSEEDKRLLYKSSYDFLTGGSEEPQQNIWEILEQEPECDGGVTKLVQNDLAVRIFGQRAQKLQEVAEKIKESFFLHSVYDMIIE